jgi:hypothetical protein
LRTNICASIALSAALRDDVDERGLAVFDYGNCFFQHRTEIVWIGDRPERRHAKALGQGRIVDEWVFQRRSGMVAIDATLATVCHALEYHAHRNLAVRGNEAFHGLNRIGQRRFGVGGDDEVDLLKALEVLIVRFLIEMRGHSVSVALDRVMEGVRRAPEALEL